MILAVLTCIPEPERGHGSAAGCIEGLCSLRSRGDNRFAAEGCGIAYGTRPLGVRVDGPSGRGLTGLRPEGSKVVRQFGVYSIVR